ncbi:MAG: CopG family transcriptional regulator [Leptolyngbya sp. SIOISBB]|nr:CopG family transcriptional regulator [Leptolyngbya sp. SIOISBB]
MSRFDQLMGSVGKKQATDLPEVQEPVSPPKPLGSSSKAKGKDPNYQRTTFYIPKDIHRAFKMAALEDNLEMSDIVEDLISQWLGERHS